MEPKQALAFLTLIGTLVGAWGQQKYFGKDLGALSELHHGVRGRLYAVDSRTLYLKDFHYDGEGPAAYFIVGSSKSVGAAGSERLPDERGNSAPLRRYRGESLTLALPEGKTLKDFRWFSVWCDEFAVNFGDVSIPRELEYPRPARVAALRGVHGVSSDPVVVVDAQTLLLPNFSYDGEAPDAKFWVGRGKAPSPQGIRIPDENGKETPLRKYDKKTIVLTLPGELTVFDVGHLAVWCEAFTVNFGHVSLPAAALANVPPSLKMLGVSPQDHNKHKDKLTQQSATSASTRASHRHKPIVKLDATTYRPLRRDPALLAALAASPGTPDTHVNGLHRRDNDDQPFSDQLVTADVRQVSETQKDQDIKNQHEVQHQNHSEGQLNVAEQQPGPRYRQLQEQSYPLQSQPEIYNEQYQTQQFHRNIYQQQILEPVYQHQSHSELEEQHQLAHQQRLLNQPQVQSWYEQREEPLQYRLLPYRYEDQKHQSEGVSIHRSIDLDLNGQPGSESGGALVAGRRTH